MMAPLLQTARAAIQIARPLNGGNNIVKRALPVVALLLAVPTRSHAVYNCQSIGQQLNATGDAEILCGGGGGGGTIKPKPTPMPTPTPVPTPPPRQCSNAIPVPADVFECQCHTIGRVNRCGEGVEPAACTSLINKALALGKITGPVGGSPETSAAAWLELNGFCPIVYEVEPGAGEKLWDFCPRGCFEAGTKILTSAAEQAYTPASAVDMSLRLAALADGASVDAPHLDARAIYNIVYGPEATPLYVFELSNGATLRVTQHHPMVLDDGTIIEAAQVSPGASFVGIDGRSVVVNDIRREKSDKDVYNFKTMSDSQAGHIIVAEGVLVGDLKLQNDLAREQSGIAARR